MSTNGVNTAEDADMAECEEEKVVTMMDVLQEQQEFEDDANAVLGASDEKNCTYSKGYIKRQAIYACLSCCDDAKIDPTKRAGVCLACSLTCHENHELIELYTKRNFRCDCGNPKFNGHPCQFVTDKPDLNEDNSYNQNFSGLYCTCHRPYPDPEAAFEDEMIQCIVCEDWLHAAHLEASVPTSEYAEMICKTCMDKNTFLHDYGGIAVDAETENVDVVGVDADTSAVNDTSECNGVTEKVNGALEDSIDTDPKVAEIDKEKKIATENDDAIKQCEPLADTYIGENKYVPEQAEGDVDKITEEISKEEKSSDNTTEISSNDEEHEKATEHKDSIVDSSTNEMNSSKTEGDKEENNDNSLMESIEKLENELGNIEPKKNLEENKSFDQTEAQTDSKVESINEEKITENENKTTENEDTTTENEDKTTENEDKTTENLDNTTENLTNENTETCVENRIIDQTTTENVESNPKEDDKQGSIENEDNDVEMNEAIDSNKDESESLSNDKNEALEPVSNGTDVEVPEALNISETKTDESTKDIKRKLSNEEVEETTSKKPKLDSSSCVRPKGVKSKLKGATFWPSNFRQKLCTCNECISMYKDLSVLFLMDPEDTVTAYEALGKQRIDGTATSQYEKGLEALSSLDRIQQINALTEYNKMRDKLLDYLKSFKDRKEVVKEEDIKAFFAGMKPKRESDGVYFCR